MYTHVCQITGEGKQITGGITTVSKKLNQQFACSRIILPEHRDQLKGQRREMDEREKYRVPLFDEQQREEFDSLLTRSLRFGLLLKVTFLKGEREKSRALIRGQVVNIDSMTGRIVFHTETGKKIIAAGRITGIGEG